MPVAHYDGDPEDMDRAEFLNSLEGEDLTNWEAEFVESNIDRRSFSEAQREVIDRLRDKY